MLGCQITLAETVTKIVVHIL